jgi:hypothetical protein
MEDLEGRDENVKALQWGPMGPPVRAMDWEEICVWLESMGAQENIVEIQRENRYSGLDFDGTFEKPWKAAIEKVTQILIFFGPGNRKGCKILSCT